MGSDKVMVSPSSIRSVEPGSGAALSDMPTSQLLRLPGRVTDSLSEHNVDARRRLAAAIDVRLEPGQSSDLRAFLRAGNRTLTETWTFPWKAE